MFVLTLALNLIPLCGKKEQLLHVSGCADDRPANPVARIFKETADDSPSPWGEGRDEGGRESKADGAHPQTGRTGRALRTPQSEFRIGNGLFS